MIRKRKKEKHRLKKLQNLVKEGGRKKIKQDKILIPAQVELHLVLMD